MNIKMISILTLLSLITPILNAEEDLLSILGGETKKSESTHVQQELTELLTQEMGELTPEKNIFFGFFDRNDHSAALYQWWSAFPSPEVISSPTGRALFAYLLFQNQLPILALEKIMEIKEVNQVLPALRKKWRDVAPYSHPAWAHMARNWNEAWTETFGQEIQMKVQAQRFINVKDTQETLNYLKKSALHSKERLWFEWQLVLGLALKGEVKKAAQVLAHLMKSEQASPEAQLSDVSRDLMTMTAARMLYQQGYLQAAERYYSKIPKSSEYWFVAQEERAWCGIRRGKPEETLGITQTLLVKDFAAHIGPETIFLESLAHLKTCNYPAVIKSIKRFQARLQPKVKRLLSLKNQVDTPMVQSLIQRMKQGRVRLVEMGSQGLSLPRFVTRDELLYRRVDEEKYLDQEVAQAERLYNNSLSGGSSQIGYQAELKRLQEDVAARRQQTRNSVLNLIKKRTLAELNEIHQILQKMHIVEAEVTQQLLSQVNTSNNGVKRDKQQVSQTKADQLRFPYEGEIWFDELDHYRVKVGASCQVLAQRGN